MVKKLYKFPQVGELVVCQAEDVQKMYVYVKLEDYEGNTPGGNARGMIHISELANRWIRNVSNFIRPNQRVVLKVLKVNEEKGHIDLSLRRVNNEQKTSRINQWKYEQKAENLLRIFAEKQENTLEEMYEKVGYTLLSNYMDLHEAFDNVKENGRELLDKFESIDLTDEQKDELFELIDQNITVRTVEIEGNFEIVTYEGNGVDIIKETIEKVTKIRKAKNVEFNFHYIGAPVYAFKIVANDYPQAEKYLKKVVGTMEEILKDYNAEVEFIRD